MLALQQVLTIPAAAVEQVEQVQWEAVLVTVVLVLPLALAEVA